MKIRIQGTPEFLVPLTLAEVELMRTVSAQHYDGVCRTASEEGYFSDNRNFLTLWKNILEGYVKYPSDDPDFVPRISATWRQLDISAKILESCNLFMLPNIDKLAAKRLRESFMQVLLKANDMYGQWYVDVDTGK